MRRLRTAAALAAMAAVAGCSSRPAPYERLGIGVSTEGEHCILALHGQRIGDLDDFQTKIRLRAALPHHPFSTGIQTVGTVPSACIQKIYEVLRAAHVQTVGILADPQNGAPVQP